MEEPIVTEGAKHLVRRDVVESKRGSPLRAQTVPITKRRLQQRKGADDIRSNKLARAVDRTIDMAFGCKMHDHVRLETVEERAHRISVDYVCLCKVIPRAIRYWRERVEISRVRQLVNDKNRVGRILNQLADDSRANKACTAGH